MFVCFRSPLFEWRGDSLLSTLITFDSCLSQSLLQKPLSERRKLLYEHFQPIPGEFDFAKSSDGEATEEIQSFLEESVKDGCEGLMVKMLDSDASFYEPSRRSVNWLKVWLILYIPRDQVETLIFFLAQKGLSCWHR